MIRNILKHKDKLNNFQQTMQHQVCHVDSKAGDIEKSDCRNNKTKQSC